VLDAHGDFILGAQTSSVMPDTVWIKRNLPDTQTDGSSLNSLDRDEPYVDTGPESLFALNPGH